jgi:hypothetical protein
MRDMLLRVQRFTSTAIDDLRVSFACSTCNAVAEADVIIASSAEVAMPIHVGEGLRDGARRDAVAGLPEAARQAVGLAGCPSCGAMDHATARWQRIATAFAALASWYGVAATVLAIVIGVIGSSATSLGTQVTSFAAAAAILALAMGLGGRARFAAKQRWARSRVTWATPTKDPERPSSA